MSSAKPSAPHAASDASPASSVAATPDVALVHHVAPDGAVHIIRRRGNQLEAGALKPLSEGVPIQGEVVSLHSRPDCPALCDVEVHYTPPASAKAPEAPHANPLRKGPAQVASDTYRDNWDSIWSRKKPTALN